MPHLISGSVLTKSNENYLPIETDYNFTRNSCSLYLPFNDPIGSKQFTDISPYNQQILNRGNVVIGSGFNSLYERSAIFDGSSNLLILNNSYFTFTGSFTIQFKMKANANPAGTTILQVGYTSSTDGFAIYSGTSASPTSNVISIYGNGSAWKITGTIPAFNGNSNLITLTRNNSNIVRLFVNGVLSGSAWTSSVVFGCGQSPLIIGGSSANSGFYTGKLSELIILNGVCLYEANFTVPTTPYVIRKEVKDEYSGVTIEGKVGEDVIKATPMYYDYPTRSWKKSIAVKSETMPAKCLAVQDAKAGDIIPLLKFGTLKYTPEPVDQVYNSIVPNMTSNNPLNGYVIRRSSAYTEDGNRTYEAWHSFNQNKSKAINSIGYSGGWDVYWLLGNSSNNELSYFNIKLDKPRIIQSYIWYPRYSDVSQYAQRWKLKASNDGTSWVLLDVQTNRTTWAANTPVTFTFHNDIAYKYYQFFDLYMTAMGELILRDENNVDIIPRMSGIVYAISASSEYSTTYPAWKAADKTIGTTESNSWLVANGNPNTGWLMYDFGYMNLDGFYKHPSINSYAITSVYHSTTWRALSTWTFEGSDNNIDWEILHSVTNDTTSWTLPGQRVEFSLGQTVSYRYYRVNVTATRQAAGTTQTYFGINELDLLYNGSSVIPKMSTYTCSPGVPYLVSASSEYSTTYTAWKAFNKTNSSESDSFLSANNAAVCWLQIDTGPDLSWKDSTITKYKITSRNYTSRGDPKSWTLSGSNDGSTWNLIDARADVAAWTSNETREYTLSSSAKYRFYKFNITDNYFTSSGTFCSIGDIDLLNGSTSILPTFAEYYGLYTIPIITPIMNAINISASTEYNTSYQAWNAFGKIFPPAADSDTYNWLTSNNVLTGSIVFDWGIKPDSTFYQYSFYYRSPIDSYSLTSYYSPGAVNYRTPKTWTFEGSNDNSNWTVLHSRTGDTTSFTGAGQTVKFSLNQIVDYRYYRISINDTNIIGSGLTYIGLLNISFYLNDKDLLVKFARNSNPLNHYIYGDFELHWNNAYTNWTPNQLFNKNPTTDDGWYVTTTSTNSERYLYNNYGAMLEVQLPSPKLVTKYGIYNPTWVPLESSTITCCWRLKGSNDNINWVLLDERLNLKSSDLSNSWPAIFNVSNPGVYRYYRLDSMMHNSLWGFDLYEPTRNWIDKMTYIDPIKGKLSIKPSESVNYIMQNIGNVNGTYFDSTSDVQVIFTDFHSSMIKDKSNNNGDVIITANTSIPSILDGPVVTEIYNSLIINAGVTVTTSNRCQGLKIVVFGDCIINGTLSMTGMGANYSPEWTTDYPITDENGNILAWVPRYGAAGALGKYIGGGTNYTKGADGSAGVNGGCGGGGSGGGYACRSYTGNGARGSCFSGGAAGGGAGGNNNNTGIYGVNAFADGGAGGCGYCGGRSDGTAYYAAGGAGNYGGDGWYGNSTYWGRYNGTGGLLILIVYGNLTIGSTGIVSADGSPAHPGSTACLGGGGGSGGGSVNVFYKNDFVNSGIIRANGGLGTQTTWNSNAVTGGNGGAGSVRTIKI